MSSSRNLARCCLATPGRWTSPPSCRKALTSCVNTKVSVLYHPHLPSCIMLSALQGGFIISFVFHSCVPCCHCLFTLLLDSVGNMFLLHTRLNSCQYDLLFKPLFNSVFELLSIYFLSPAECWNSFMLKYIITQLLLLALVAVHAN